MPDSYRDRTDEIRSRLVDVIEDEFEKASPIQITAALLRASEEYIELARELNGGRDE